MTIESLLYQPLSFIIALIQCTSKRNRIEQKEAWQIRYVYILYLVHVYFLNIKCKSIIGDNDSTELRALLMLMFVRTYDFLRVSINQYPQHLGCF